MSLNRINEDGTRTSIPPDPRNRDYRAYLAETGKTHEAVLAEEQAATEVVLAAARTETTRRNAAARSGRDKLLALGLTRAEFRALFNRDED